MASQQNPDVEASNSKDYMAHTTLSHDNDPKDLASNEDIVRVIDHAAEKSLALKFDFRILPVLAVMCKLRIATCIDRLLILCS